MPHHDAYVSSQCCDGYIEKESKDPKDRLQMNDEASARLQTREEANK